MATGAYVHALEIDIDNSWAGDVGSRSARSSQVMNAESLGTYHRPVQVFKYMHLHEYMQGRGHSVVPAPGTLGAGAVAVRDKMRSLHLGKLEAGESGKRKSRPLVQLSGMENAGRSSGGGPSFDNEFVNKGYLVWEAVRREWRGRPEQVAAARTRRQAERQAEVAARAEADGYNGGEGDEGGSDDVRFEEEDDDLLEDELSDDGELSRRWPLPAVTRTLDRLWEDEHEL